MRPCYVPGTVLVVHPTSYFMLRRGMPVVYRNQSGRQVAHVLLEEGQHGWIAQGLNNRDSDDDLVTADNLIGIVTCAYVPREPATPLSGPVAMVRSERSM